MKRTHLQAAILSVVLSCSRCVAEERARPPEDPNVQRSAVAPTVFTHFPVDLASLFSAERFPGTSPIQPFFSYDNTAHAEGPRKWYIYGSQSEPMKVFLPARASLQAGDLRDFEGSKALTLNGEKVRPNLNVTFQVDPDLRLFFMHLALREAIAQNVERAGRRTVTFDAGTHIGYIHNPPWNSLDFGVEDRRKNSGMAADSNLWWNLRANPLDYFTPALRQQILGAYRPTLERFRADGTIPFSDLTDSRANINVKGTLWGVWFKDDLEDPFRDHDVNWSIINLVPTNALPRESYWKALQEDPAHAGLFTENGQGKDVGRQLYPGHPLGRSRFYILSGDERRGTAKIVQRQDGNRVVFLKFELISSDPENVHREHLVMEGFPTAEEAANSTFSAKAVEFRRNPSRTVTVQQRRADAGKLRMTVCWSPVVVLMCFLFCFIW